MMRNDYSFYRQKKKIKKHSPHHVWDPDERILFIIRTLDSHRTYYDKLFLPKLINHFFPE